MTWPMVELGELVTIKGGGTPSKSIDAYWGGDVPWASVKDFKSRYISQTQDCITQAGVKNSATNIIPEGVIVIPTRMALGKVAITACDMAINQDLKALFVNDECTLDRNYLARYLESKANYIESEGKGATVKGITLDFLKSIKVPLPPLEEQKRIAAILDKADAIRQKRQQAIALADQFLRSVFLDMFVNSSNEAWDIKSIEYIADPKNGGLRTGPFGSQLLHSEFVESGISVLGIDNAVENQFKWGKPRFITEEKYQTLSRYTVHPEDVLITIMGTCGRCAVVPCDIPKAINTKHLCCITLDKKKALPEFLHSYYLFHPMSQRYLAQKTKGAIMDGLNMGIIKEMPFPMVPLELQERFVSIKNATISSVGKQHLLEENQQLLFNVLSKKAFSGQL